MLVELPVCQFCPSTKMLYEHFLRCVGDSVLYNGPIKVFYCILFPLKHITYTNFANFVRNSQRFRQTLTNISKTSYRFLIKVCILLINETIKLLLFKVLKNIKNLPFWRHPLPLCRILSPKFEPLSEKNFSINNK